MGPIVPTETRLRCIGRPNKLDSSGPSGRTPLNLCAALDRHVPLTRGPLDTQGPERSMCRAVTLVLICGRLSAVAV